MHKPKYERKGIPFFHDKSEKEIQADLYERFDPMVIRQSALHLSDDIWGTYPFQKITDFVLANCSENPVSNVVELGCGVGRLTSALALKYNEAACWGLDYSYQMLKRAKEVWMDGSEVFLNLSRYGFSAAHSFQHQTLPNLSFGLAKAEQLPFDDNSQDLVVSSFLFDRLQDPMAALTEMKRVLQPAGRIILVTPLNFSKAQHWEAFYPAIKTHQLLLKMGFDILEWKEDLLLEEPLDLRRNCVRWKGLGIVLQKNKK